MRNNAPTECGAGPLSDLRVLELGTLIAGPFAGRLFAEFGAEVIKVEHPDRGDPLRNWGMTWDGTDSLWHLIQSRGKLSVTADLNEATDQAFVRRLALESDILIENFRPGRLEKWNLDPQDLMDANPGLSWFASPATAKQVRCATSRRSERSRKLPAACDFITGEPDRPPTRVGLSLADSIASLTR